MNSLKLSAPDWCFFPEGESPEVYYKRLKEMGYSGVEMLHDGHTAHALKAGLEIVNIAAPGMEDGLNNRANHEKISTEILKLTDFAVTNKIPYIIVFSGNENGISYEEGFNNCLDAFFMLLYKMRGSGVKLLFEMLNPFDHAGYQGWSEKFGFDLAKELKSDDFKLLYDIYHIYKGGEEPLDNLAEKLPYIGHFHIANLDGRTFPEESGKIDYCKILNSIPPESYSGYFGMEFLTQNPYEELDKAAKLFNSYKN